MEYLSSNRAGEMIARFTELPVTRAITACRFVADQHGRPRYGRTRYTLTSKELGEAIPLAIAHAADLPSFRAATIDNGLAAVLAETVELISRAAHGFGDSARRRPRLGADRHRSFRRRDRSPSCPYGVFAARRARADGAPRRSRSAELTKSSAAAWFADGSPITATDPEFGSVKFTPKHVGAMSSYSRTMLVQSSPDVEGVMRADLAAVLGEALDKAVLVGAGTAEPLGIVGQSGVTALDTAGSGALVHDDALEAIAAVVEADAELTGFAMSPSVATVLRKIKDTQGRPLGIISGIGRAATMEMLPVATTTNLPAFAAGELAMIAGDFRDSMIGLWGALDVLVNPYSAAEYARGAVAVRAILTADVQVRHGESFCALSVAA